MLSKHDTVFINPYEDIFTSGMWENLTHVHVDRVRVNIAFFL